MRPFEIEMIREASRPPVRKTTLKQFKEAWETGPEARLFVTKPANDWLNQSAQNTPELNQLFGSFWLEGELCILFADTNLGKSILAVQIADAITRNYSIGPFTNQCRADTPVLYLDCEQTARQFEVRYTDAQHGRHHFAPHFYRAEYNPELDAPMRQDNYQNYMRTELEQAIAQTRARVLIIDNITYLRNGIQSGSQALPLMKTLKALKTRHNLSVLVLAHTPKRYAASPLTVNDLQGSKMLINFADSAFAIGQSQAQPHLRYLKQIKQRSAQQQYGAANICLISPSREFGLLGYQFESFGTEARHLRHPAPSQVEIETIIQLHTQGLPLRQIANQVHLHYTSVGRIIARHKKEMQMVEAEL